MTDYFALLNETRRPWLDPEELKQKFLVLSAQFHPDRFHRSTPAERQAAGERYTEINTAYNCLREPRNRLRHLLELELGSKPADIQRVPEEMMDEMFVIGRLCRETDAFLADKNKVTSPILKVQWFERGQVFTEKLNAEQQKLDVRREQLLDEVRSMNSAWETASTAGTNRSRLPLERLDTVYRLFGYLGRWSEQLRERIVQLSI